MGIGYDIDRIDGGRSMYKLAARSMYELSDTPLFTFTPFQSSSNHVVFTPALRIFQKKREEFQGGTNKVFLGICVGDSLF